MIGLFCRAAEPMLKPAADGLAETLWLVPTNGAAVSFTAEAAKTGEKSMLCAAMRAMKLEARRAVRILIAA